MRFLTLYDPLLSINMHCSTLAKLKTAAVVLKPVLLSIFGVKCSIPLKAIQRGTYLRLAFLSELLIWLHREEYVVGNGALNVPFFILAPLQASYPVNSFQMLPQDFTFSNGFIDPQDLQELALRPRREILIMRLTSSYSNLTSLACLSSL